MKRAARLAWDRADRPNAILDAVAVPTSTPTETIDAALAFFSEASAELGNYTGFGIASFGPVDLDLRSPGWSRIMDTPKVGWSGIDLVEPFSRGCRSASTPTSMARYWPKACGAPRAPRRSPIPLSRTG